MFELVAGDDRTTLVVNGEVTIQSALAFKEALQAGIEKGNALELDLGAVTEADLTGLQLICATRRALSAMKKTLTVTGGLPESVLKAAEEAGFTRDRGCRGDACPGCIWMMRDEYE